MGVTIDPEGTETRVLHELVDFAGKDVVEIGCGDGRMTWRYAGRARSVLGLDPNEAQVSRASESTPDNLKSIVTFRAGNAASVGLPEQGFDVAILSWSLWWIARESVGDTLRILHRSLRPGGILLDLHPEPEHARILVRIGQETREVGALDDTAYIDDIHAGRAVIASLIREQLFTRDRDVVFEQVLHASDVDTWLAYREERSTRSILDPRIIGRVRDLLAEAGGEILVVNRGYAGRLVRR